MIAYVAVTVGLSVMPLLNALAFIVVVVLTDIGLEYEVDDNVGSEPSRVYRTVALLVLQVMATD